MDPFLKFQNWYKKELEAASASIPSACCLSTTGTDGYPNARFVSLKEVKNEQLIVTGPLDSRKGSELMHRSRAALTFWWDATGKQVRVQGDVHQIDPSRADRYFSQRSRESQIVSWVSKQGRPLQNSNVLKDRVKHFSDLYENKEIPRPKNWGGLSIVPVRIEFLEFSLSRLHDRVLYVRSGNDWCKQGLQP